MADRTLNARLRLTGGNKVKQAIDGTASKAKEASRSTRQAQKRAQRAMVQDVKKAEREKVRALKKTEREAMQAERGRRRAAKRAIDAIARDTRKAERARRREFERTRREEERAERRRARGSAGARAGGAIAAAGVPLAAAGIGIGALQQTLSEFVRQTAEVVSAVEQAGGVQGVGERTVTAQEFDRELVRLGGEVFGDVDPDERRRQLAGVRDEINSIALATGQEPGQLLTALGGLQTEFSAFEFGRENLRALADEAARTGAPVEQLARFAGLVRQQFGEMETSRIFDILAQGGLQGALDPESLSRDFSGQLGLYASFVDPNQEGSSEDRLRSFVATANVLRQSGLSSNESATLMQNMFASLSRERVQENIALATGGRRGRGGTVTGGIQLQDFRSESGQLDLAGYIEALQAEGSLTNLEQVGRAVGDQQASQALNTLISARKREVQSPEGNADIRELMNVSAEEGARFRAANLADVQQTSAFQRDVVGVRGQVEGSRNEGARSSDAIRRASLNEALRQQGAIGRYIANNDTLSTLAGSVQGTGVEDALDSVFQLRSQLRGDAEGGRRARAGGLLGALQQESAAAAGGKAPAAASKEDVQSGMRAALRGEGPLPVQVVNQPAGGSPSSGGANRSQSPRERGGDGWFDAVSDWLTG